MFGMPSASSVASKPNGRQTLSSTSTSEPSNDNLYDDYVNYARRYKAAYGDKTTLVAYEVGKFLNWYNCDRNLGCDVLGVCECINVAVTRRNKNIPEVSRKNPMMGGVPRDAFFNKHLRVLIENDYTVVVVSQLSSSSDDEKGSAGMTRGVTDVISKGVYLDAIGGGGGAVNHSPYSPNGGEAACHQNSVMALYVSETPTASPVLINSSSTAWNNDNNNKQRKGGTPALPGSVTDVGCAFVDLSTGHSWAYELNSSSRDPNFARDETCRLIQEHEPKEAALYGRPASLAALLGLPFPNKKGKKADEGEEEESDEGKAEEGEEKDAEEEGEKEEEGEREEGKQDEKVEEKQLGPPEQRVGGRTGAGLNDRKREKEDMLSVSDLVNAFGRDMSLNPRSIRCRLTDSVEELNGIEKVKFQEHALRAVFPDTGFLTAIEALNLENRPHAAAAYVALLQFIFEHNEHVVRDMPRPSVHTSDGDTECSLELTYNAAEQLDIISPGSRPASAGSAGCTGGGSAVGGGGKGTLLDVLDCCSTRMGRRLFKRRLLHPSSDVSVISSRLDQVQARLQDSVEVRSRLASVRDLDRLFRKIALRRIEPYEFDLIDSSLASVEEASSVGRMDALNNAAGTVRGGVAAKLDMEEARRVLAIADARTNVFVRGSCPEIDDLQDSARIFRGLLTQLVERLNAKQGSGFFKLVQEDIAAAPHIVGTSRRCASMASNLSNETFVLAVEGHSAALPVSEIKIESCSSSSSSTSSSSPASRLVHPLLESWSKSTTDAEKEVRKLVKKEYARFLDAFWAAHGTRMLDLAREVAQLDVSCASAQNANVLRYVRPSFGPVDPADATADDEQQNDNKNRAHNGDGSQLRCTRLRHPIVEVMNTRIPHVANDICLGLPESKGMLLYGMNAAGKSCLMKAAALAVVMAQAGMFVPCRSMHITVPFRRVLTRIRSRDDLVRGQSTFMVEMSELRDILQRCDARSLVIGDEVCSGTESVSALAIVGASIRNLLAEGTPFIFATHLHELPSLLARLHRRDPENSKEQHEGLRVCHLRVDYDAARRSLVYDRRLCDGQGPTVYGLEVCRALDMHPEFLDNAHSIRRILTGVPDRLDGSSSPGKASHFNARIVMGSCGLCGKRSSSETHHIRPQAEADEKGFIGTHHKNAAFNLVPLCEECHDAVHSGKINVEGYVQTSGGVRLRSYVVDNDDDDDN